MISSQLQHDLHTFIEYTKTIKIIKNKNYFYIFFFICRSQTTASPSFNIYRKKPSPSFGYSGRWLFVLFLYLFHRISYFAPLSIFTQHLIYLLLIYSLRSKICFKSIVYSCHMLYMFFFFFYFYSFFFSYYVLFFIFKIIYCCNR